MPSREGARERRPAQREKKGKENLIYIANAYIYIHMKLYIYIIILCIVDCIVYRYILHLMLNIINYIL